MTASLAFFFPGQGSQKLGMGVELCREFPVARQVFEEANQLLGFSLSSLCEDGPEADLALTSNTQPAILTTSIAALRVIESELGLKPSVALGHSLGEFSALVAVGALRFSDAVQLVHLRGKAMQEAVPEGVGAMAAVMGLDLAAVESLCDEARIEGEQLAPANENGATQIVVAGHAGSVSRLVDLAAEKRARAVPLKVSAPFHCALMQPAADRLAEALESIDIHPMKAPVISNVDAEENRDASRVKDLLITQVTNRVRWESSVRRAFHMGIREGLEFGSGKVLKGLIRRIEKELSVTPVGTPADIRALTSK